jgi:hypothetical protein
MIIRQDAFGGNVPMLKGALHCHTTRSDGKCTPEEVLQLHKEHNYDFVAITDHRRYNRQHFAPETGITIIPGMEFDSAIEYGHGFRCFHTVCIGPNDETNPYEQDQRFQSGRTPTQEEYQPYLDQLHKDAQMTIHCHPEWSGTPARYFEKLKGNFAMEIWNTGCAIEDNMDTNAACWDELLDQFIKIYGVATDDGHQPYQHCGGWVMVNAENNVPAILDALKNGRFYSSCGPKIYDFYIEDDVAHIVTDPCAMIQFVSACHPLRVTRSKDGSLTHAELKIDRGFRYLRATIVDAQGRRAWTNPIFLRPHYDYTEEEKQKALGR